MSGDHKEEVDGSDVDSRTEHTSIASLPTEILLLVFRFVWLDSQTQDDEAELGEFDPTLFPFAVAHVCRRWLDLLSSESEYWDKILIRLDSPCFSPYVIEKYLARSKCHAFFISYDGSAQGPMLSVEEEHRRIDLVMSYLAPRLDECSRLVLVITYRSSIVRAIRGIAGRALPSLSELTLHSVVTDTTDDLPFIPIKPVKENIDIFQIYADPKSLINVASFIDEETLQHMQENIFILCAIHPYLPLDGSGIRPNQLLSALERLQGRAIGKRSLHVRNVAFEEEPEDSAPHDVLELDSVVLDNVGAAFLTPLFNSIMDRPEETHILRCKVPAGTKVSGQRLTLTRIKSPDDVRSALTDWEGTELELRGCHGFNDEVIAAMSPKHEDDSGFVHVLCPRVQSLKITKCPFSSHALVDMLKARRKMNQDDDFENRIRIRMVEVKGGPPLEKEDREWLEQVKDRGLRYRWVP